jgi:hypothetical protein
MLRIVIIVLAVLYFTGFTNRFLARVAETYRWMQP